MEAAECEQATIYDAYVNSWNSGGIPRVRVTASPKKESDGGSPGRDSTPVEKGRPACTSVAP